MAVKPIPEGYQTVIPYLVVNDAQKLLDFLQAAFNAEVIERMTTAEGTVNHAEVKIGDCVVMMGKAQETSQTTYSMVYVYVEDTDATYQRALKAGAVSIMQPTRQFYGDRNAAVKDAFGNQWWIATRVEDVSKEELEQRAREKNSQQI